MLSWRWLGVLVTGPLLILSGCGSVTSASANGSAQGSSSSTFLSGNWQIQSGPYGPSTNAPGLVGLFGNLQSGSNGALSGVFRIFVSDAASGCPPLNESVSVTGSVDSTGGFTLKSAPIAGSILNVALHPISGTPITMAGTMDIAGAGCHVASGPALGLAIKPVSGTFKGTVTPSQGSVLPGGTATGPSAALTLNLSQAATPNAGGQYSVTGSLALAGTACNYSAPFVGETLGIGVLAAPIVSPFNGGSINGVDYTFIGSANPGGGGIDFANLNLPVSAGCGTVPFTGQLTKQ